MTTSIRVRARLIGATAALMAWAVPSACAYAQTAAGRGEIPATVAAALSDVRIPTSAIGIVVAPLDGGSIQLAANESRPMNPASTMKLLTTYAALNLLGPTFQWRTEVYATSRPHVGRLEVDLVLSGSGDPSLVIERFWVFVHRLRGLGVRQIHGNLVLDKSAFEPDVASGASLDGNDLRPYNVTPDALLVNFKALSLDFVPDPEASVARIIATPALAGVRLPASVPLANGSCGDWRERLRADFSNPWAPRFTGRYSLDCAEQTWHVSLLDHTHFVGAAFRALWEGAGGTWNGHVREARAPPGAIELLAHESPPLSEIVRDINKFSNNVMARQVFLTLGAPDPGQPRALGTSRDGVAHADRPVDAGAGAGKRLWPVAPRAHLGRQPGPPAASRLRGAAHARVHRLFAGRRNGRHDEEPQCGLRQCVRENRPAGRRARARRLRSVQQRSSLRGGRDREPRQRGGGHRRAGCAVELGARAGLS